MTRRDIYLLAYDIPDDRRRNRVLSAVRAFGLDSQYSAHECLLSPGERNEIWNRLEAIADPSEDRILAVRLDPRLETLLFGRSPATVRGNFLYSG